MAKNKMKRKRHIKYNGDTYTRTNAQKYIYTCLIRGSGVLAKFCIVVAGTVNVANSKSHHLFANSFNILTSFYI